MPGLNARSLQILYGTLGLAGFFAIWQIIGDYQLAGLSWPPLTAVLQFLFDPDRLALFSRAMEATLRSTAAGYATGALAGAILASIAPYKEAIVGSCVFSKRLMPTAL